MTDETRRFLSHLFAGARGYFEITLIHPLRAERNVKTYSYALGTERPQWDKIAAMNADGWSVYYGVTTNRKRVQEWQRRRKADVYTLTALWSEIDYKDGVYSSLADVHARLSDFREIPTAMLSSGGGIHLLWRVAPVEVTDANRPAIEETLRGIAVALRSDTSVAETARVLRLPGSINTKPERDGARCELIDLIPGEYTLDDFAGYRVFARPVRRKVERDLPRIRTDDLPTFVARYLKTPVAQGKRNVMLYTAARHMNEAGRSQGEAESTLLGKARDDGLDENEALNSIRSGYNAKGGLPSYVTRRTAARMRAGDAVKRSCNSERDRLE